MHCEAKTEKEMHEHRAPTPESFDQLSQYIESLTDRRHDYGTAVYAMSLAATAAFNFVANRIGVTGFQESCADLDIIRRTRHIDGPFAIFEAMDMLYPQYDLKTRLDELTTEWTPWAAEQVVKRLKDMEENKDAVHPLVLAHWKALAAKVAPAAPAEQEAK